VPLQEEIESLFVSVRDIILAKPSEDIAELAGLINSSPRRRRMQELQLDDLQHLLQVSSQLPMNHCSCKKRQDYAFRRQCNEKPSVIPGCPGHSSCNGARQIVSAMC